MDININFYFLVPISIPGRLTNASANAPRECCLLQKVCLPLASLMDLNTNQPQINHNFNASKVC